MGNDSAGRPKRYFNWWWLLGPLLIVPTLTWFGWAVGWYAMAPAGMAEWGELPWYLPMLEQNYLPAGLIVVAASTVLCLLLGLLIGILFRQPRRRRRPRVTLDSAVLVMFTRLILPAGLVTLWFVNWETVLGPRGFEAQGKLHIWRALPADAPEVEALGKAYAAIGERLEDDLYGQRAIGDLILGIDELSSGLARTSSDPDSPLSYRSRRELEARIRQLGEAITVDIVKPTSRNGDIFVTVRATHWHPELPAKIVQRLLHSYIENAKYRLLGELKDTARYCELEQTRARESVEEHREALLTFIGHHADILPGSDGSIDTRLQAAQSQQVLMVKALEDARTRLASNKAYVESSPRYLVSGSATDDPELQSLEDTRTSLLEAIDGHRKLGVDENDPDHKRDLDALAEVDRKIEAHLAASGGTWRINQRRQVAEREIPQLEARIKLYEKDLVTFDARIERLRARQREAPALLAAHGELEKALEDAERTQRLWGEKHAHAERALNMELRLEAIRMQVIEKPGFAPQAIQPRWRMAAERGLIVGGIAGAVILLVQLVLFLAQARGEGQVAQSA